MEWPLLASLSEEERSEFTGLARRRTFARQEVVCHAGDPADSLHLVVRGRLSVTVSLPTGDTAMVNVLGPGSYFGELALVGVDAHRTATVTALEPTETFAVPASAFRRLRESHPGVERAMTTLLADRIDRLSGRLVEAMYVGLDRRVTRRLVEVGEMYAESDADGCLVVPLTQRQLAELTGGTRQSVNQVLQGLVDQGIIAVGRGRIDILDARQLKLKSGL